VADAWTDIVDTQGHDLVSISSSRHRKMNANSLSLEHYLLANYVPVVNYFVTVNDSMLSGVPEKMDMERATVVGFWEGPRVLA